MNAPFLLTPQAIAVMRGKRDLKAVLEDRF